MAESMKDYEKELEESMKRRVSGRKLQQRTGIQPEG